VPLAELFVNSTEGTGRIGGVPNAINVSPETFLTALTGVLRQLAAALPPDGPAGVRQSTPRIPQQSDDH
jgi:hypothetical protein